MSELRTAVQLAYESAVRDVERARDPNVEHEYDYALACDIDEETQRFEASSDEDDEVAGG